MLYFYWTIRLALKKVNHLKGWGAKPRALISLGCLAANVFVEPIL